MIPTQIGTHTHTLTRSPTHDPLCSLFALMLSVYSSLSLSLSLSLSHKHKHKQKVSWFSAALLWHRRQLQMWKYGELALGTSWSPSNPDRGQGHNWENTSSIWSLFSGPGQPVTAPLHLSTPPPSVTLGLQPNKSSMNPPQANFDGLIYTHLYIFLVTFSVVNKLNHNYFLENTADTGRSYVFRKIMDYGQTSTVLCMHNIRCALLWVWQNSTVCQ